MYFIRRSNRVRLVFGPIDGQVVDDVHPIYCSVDEVLVNHSAFQLIVVQAHEFQIRIAFSFQAPCIDVQNPHEMTLSQ